MHQFIRIEYKDPSPLGSSSSKNRFGRLANRELNETFDSILGVFYGKNAKLIPGATSAKQDI